MKIKSFLTFHIHQHVDSQIFPTLLLFSLPFNNSTQFNSSPQHSKLDGIWKSNHIRTLLLNEANLVQCRNKCSKSFTCKSQNTRGASRSWAMIYLLQSWLRVGSLYLNNVHPKIFIFRHLKSPIQFPILLTTSSLEITSK